MTSINTTYGRSYDSKMIKQSEYTPDTKVLVVTFNNGQQYSYEDVDEDVMEEFMDPESAGKFFLENIKGHYEYEKLDDE
jgi:hypothetical protein